MRRMTMNHRNAFASVALALVAAVSFACSAAPDGVVLDREDEPLVPATATAATATTRAQLGHESDAGCVSGRCYVP